LSSKIKLKKMKKIYSLLFIAFASQAFSQQALPFTDAFSYPVGNLHETAPWSVLGTASTTGDHILLDGTKVTFAAGGTDAQLNITPQTTGTVYYKFSLNITSMAGVSDVNGGYIAGLAQNTTTFGGTLWAKRVDDNTYNLGIETRTANGANTTYTSGTYNTGTTYIVVVGYTFNSGTTSDDVTTLWVNPTVADAGTPLLTDTHTGTDITQAASFFLRQDSVTETGIVEVDDLKITNVFAETLANNSFSISGLNVYPNPVKNGIFYITTDANAERTVTVFDIVGKQVLNTTTSESAINVANLNSGVYMVQITEEGKTATKKLVIR
jgi:Secretion system C-terminal sorting domain